eukprot:5016518-Amphidinium_carterae.1
MEKWETSVFEENSFTLGVLFSLVFLNSIAGAASAVLVLYVFVGHHPYILAGYRGCVVPLSSQIQMTMCLFQGIKLILAAFFKLKEQNEH